RVSRRKEELLKVLERPEIPLHTKASENDLRTFVTKRKMSGGTMSRDGKLARDTMLGLMKTCKKLRLSFYHYLGDRIGVAGQAVPALSTPVLARSSVVHPYGRSRWAIAVSLPRPHRPERSPRSRLHSLPGSAPETA